jgi:hypothetical protein
MNHSDFYKKKKRLLQLIDRLDLQAEIVPLSDSKRKEMAEANDLLAKLRRDEESKRYKELRSNMSKRGLITQNIFT